MQISVQVLTLNDQRHEMFSHHPIYIGREKEACLRLQGWRVGARHARIFIEDKQLFNEDLGSLQGTVVNNERIKYFGPIQPQDQILIGPYRLFFQLKEKTQSLSESNTKYAVSEAALKELAISTTGFSVSAQSQQPSYQRVQEQYLQHQSLISKLREQVFKQMNLREMVAVEVSQQSIKERVQQVAREALKKEHFFAKGEISEEVVLGFVLADVCGLGPLEWLLQDSEVSEIMVNGLDGVFVERNGICEPVSTLFTSEEQIRNVIERIVAPLGRRVDESMPMVDARSEERRVGREGG